jgi:hypothetical protein
MKWYDPALQHARQSAEIECQETKLLARDRARRRRLSEADAARHQFAGEAPEPVPEAVRAKGWLPLSDLRRAMRERDHEI